MVVRRDLQVESLGVMAQLPPDLSPLQMGTTGRFRGLAFQLLGRLRLAWSGGSWNEWHAMFGDGRRGWVAEAQGIFMVSFEQAPPEGLPQVKLGDQVKLGSGRYKVTDIKETSVIAGEGELPFVSVPGRKATSVDLTAAGGEFGNIEVDGQRASAYTGYYARFDELEFSNLRPVPGWSPEAPTLQAARGAGRLSCLSCGAPMELRALGVSMSAACGHCGTIVDTSRPEWRQVEGAASRTKRKPPLELGIRGKLLGHTWEIIGYQHRRAQGYGWDELLLFNPWQGFLWLTHFQGHWNLVERVFDEPEEVPRGANLDGEHYRIFSEVSAITVFVLGEFYWQLRANDAAKVVDFVAPPHVLSRESHVDIQEVTWSKGEYLDRKKLEAGFGPVPSRPDGIFMNQPNPHAAKAKRVWKVAPWALLGAILIQFVGCKMSSNQQVFEVAFPYKPSAQRDAFVSEPFEIKPSARALKLSTQAPVNNQWLEATISLVKEDGQVLAELGEEVALYEDEGSDVTSRKIPAVPPGTYRLRIETSADATIRMMPVRVSVTSNVVLWWNFLIAIFLLMAYPCYLWIRSARFEHRRWADSDFSG